MMWVTKNNSMCSIFLMILLSFLADAQHDKPVCRKGTFFDGARCQPCPRNTFSDSEAATECTPCPPLQQSDTFSKSISDCSPCDPGKFFDVTVRGQSCRSCPANTFSKGNSTECTPCPPGLVSTSSSAECMECPLGSFAERRFQRLICTRCPRGQTTTTGNATSCTKCLPGTFQPKGGQQRDRLMGVCKPCPPGSFTSFAGKTKCAKCPRGSFQDLPGSTSCKGCPRKSTSRRRGAKQCRPTCDESEPGCISCLPGFGFNSKSGTCEQCPPGTISPARSTTPCYACPVGQGSVNAARTKCTCEPGFRLRKDGKCEECDSGKSNEDGGRCICVIGGAISKTCECPPFTKNVNNRCERCNPKKDDECEICLGGTEFNRNLGRCEECPANTFSGFDGKRCKPCPADSTSMPGSFVCSCRPGSGIINGKCTTCPKGSRSADTECVPCSPQSFSDIVGAVRCKLCPSGRRPIKEGATSCLPPCPLNSMREDFLDSEECVCDFPFEPVREDGKLECRKCGQNEVLNFSDKCVCPSGVFGGSDGKLCQPCGKGLTEKDFKCVCIGTLQADGTCLPCPRGSALKGKKCVKCPFGEIAPKPGSEFCDLCRPAESDIKRIRCLPKCPANSFRDLKDLCKSCKTGEKRKGRECVACEDGSVSRGGDVNVCTKCSDGKLPDVQQSKCV